MSTQFGLNPRIFLRSLRGLPRYVSDVIRFRKKYDGKFVHMPCLHDWYEEGGAANNEYFWQDLYVAQKIFATKPERHVDIGSRLDGFVAHVAAFRDIEVFDIRPVTPVIPGVVFSQADLMNPSGLKTDYCDSLSCLHALEHFGLGRYGDPINVDGYVAGLSNMVGILKQKGVFYLAVPIGQARVEFNANRLFDPVALLALAESNGLDLKDFAWVEPGKPLTPSYAMGVDLEMLSKRHYALGIFTFIKK